MHLLIFRKPQDAMEKILTEYNRFDDSSDGVDGPLYQAIKILQSNFLNNKEVNFIFQSICVTTFVIYFLCLNNYNLSKTHMV
jgi:hypothetical protein